MNTMKDVVVLTGAGISAESGLKTFRDSDGLWEGYDVTQVATPGAWERNPELVLRFYNERRKSVREASPNAAHLALAELERKFKVTIVTQNIDDLHERAGSSNIIHLHGEIFKSRSSTDPGLIYPIEGTELKLGETCERGSQLRPHIVWFGEPVPKMVEAIQATGQAEIFIIVGTSLVVYPAAGLVEYARAGSLKYLIDPKAEPLAQISNLKIIREKATVGVPLVVKELLNC
jgi:NAD-dependent deacetylase